MTPVPHPPAPAPARHPRTPDATAGRPAPVSRDGDPVRAERLVRELHRDVWRYVAHLSGDVQAADDLTQEVFLRALTGLPRFEGRSSARTWLLSIARRTVADSFRRAAARPRLADRDDWLGAAERAQPRGMPGFEEGVALAELLASIPPDRREAFVLTRLLGVPYAEAARIIGCPVGTVRSRVARARLALVGLLTDTGPEPGAPGRDGPPQPVGAPAGAPRAARPGALRDLGRV
ncbi:sigma-70 family RNA polymerase sigma factor [Streptomyces sp. NPDC006296]|uniref:sigma-70 family RNA polymerase sigma factor n=1 Tax=Streptomyces sp. NPDC006296 TaxID=3156746 RepID=UPI0033B91B39